VPSVAITCMTRTTGEGRRLPFQAVSNGKAMKCSIVASLGILAVIAADSPALAADPTTADCLAASDASLKAGNEHKVRAERAQLLVYAATTCPADIRKECSRGSRRSTPRFLPSCSRHGTRARAMFARLPGEITGPNQPHPRPSPMGIRFMGDGGPEGGVFTPRAPSALSPSPPRESRSLCPDPAQRRSP